MKTALTKTATAFFFSALFLAGSGSAIAADTLSSQVNTALEAKNLAEIQRLLTTGPGNVDEVIKAMLKKTQAVMSTDAPYSSKMMSLSGQYAPQITPPTVPAVCADIRRIVEALTPEQVGSDLFKSVMTASESFAKAPVVVAAGRPNDCEQALLIVATLAGEEALLAQLPGMRGPGLPPVTVRPGIPPGIPTDEEKSSPD